jgi:hypothetical protein
LSAPSKNLRFALLLGAVAVSFYLTYVVLQLMARSA